MSEVTKQEDIMTNYILVLNLIFDLNKDFQFHHVITLPEVQYKSPQAVAVLRLRSTALANAIVKHRTLFCQRESWTTMYICIPLPFTHLLKPLRSHIQSFGTLGQLLKIPPFVNQNIA